MICFPPHHGVIRASVSGSAAERLRAIEINRTFYGAQNPAIYTK